MKIHPEVHPCLHRAKIGDTIHFVYKNVYNIQKIVGFSSFCTNSKIIPMITWGTLGNSRDSLIPGNDRPVKLIKGKDHNSSRYWWEGSNE